MRKKYTFIVTVLESEENDRRLRGRLQLVQNGAEKTFTDATEMNRLIVEFMDTANKGSMPDQAKEEPPTIPLSYL